MRRPNEKDSTIAFGLSEVAEEGIVVGIACLKHLSEVLKEQNTSAHNGALAENIKAIATLLAGVCSKFVESSHITVDSFDQCQGIAKVLETLAQGHSCEETCAHTHTNIYLAFKHPEFCC